MFYWVKVEKMGTIKLPLFGPAGLGLFAMVDNDYDGEYFSQYRWRLNPKGYVVRPEWNEGKQVYIYLHHEVMSKPPVGLVRDHINRDKLDNRSCNLRWATHSESRRNQDRMLTNKSK